MNFNHSVPRERFDHAIRHGAEHMRPLFIAARDAGVAICLVAQRSPAFMIPSKRPSVLLIGDDMHEAMGPGGFHQKSIRRFVRRCRSAVIVSCAPLVEAYASAAAVAAGLRLDVILVETRIEHEAAWKDFIEAARPGVSFLIATVEPQGGVH